MPAGHAPPPPIADSRTAAALLAPCFDRLGYEQLFVLYLDADLRPLGVTRTPPGTRHAVQMPVRTLIADALGRDACKLILAHNHPDGDPMPSRADRDATRRLSGAGRHLGIAVIDHLVFAADAWISFRALGLL